MCVGVWHFLFGLGVPCECVFSVSFQLLQLESLPTEAFRGGLASASAGKAFNVDDMY